MKKFILPIILALLSLSANAQNLTPETAKNYIINYGAVDLNIDLVHRFENDDDHFNLPILSAILPVFDENRSTRNIVANCHDLCGDIFRNSKTQGVRSKAFCTLLNMAKQQEPIMAEADVYKPLARSTKPSDFNEEVTNALLEILRSDNKDYSTWLLRMIGTNKNEKFIPTIKSEYLNNCKNEYTPTSACFEAKCTLAQLGVKQYQKEVFEILSRINNKEITEIYLTSISFIRIPESINFLVKVMNDSKCTKIYDFETNEQEPCSGEVIKTIVEMTSNIPPEIKKIGFGGVSPRPELVAQTKKWINENKSKLKLNNVDH
ncbi:MAG: hypothetical protein ACOYOA_12680 [Saprospiraceae bacterium]